MKLGSFCLAAVCALALASAAAQETAPATIGGDTFAAGDDARLQAPAARDAFVVGFSVDVGEDVAEDAHYAGFSVESGGTVGGDLYAAGFTVEIEKPVGGDLTASGFRVSLDDGASVGGNARLAGRSVRVEGDVAGALVAAAEKLTLAGVVSGDVSFSGRRMRFRDGARIAGSLAYSAPERIDIPPSVISADRVSYSKLELPDVARRMCEHFDRTTGGWFPAFWGVVFGAILALLSLVVVGALLLAFSPATVERLRASAMRRPWVAILSGVLGLAMLIGLVPVSAMTLVGIPFIPLIVLLIVTVWIAGYLLGAYALAWRVLEAFRPVPETLAGRLVLLAGGLVVLLILNFIPFIGWIANLLVVFLGLGTLAAALFGRIVGPQTAAGTA